MKPLEFPQSTKKLAHPRSMTAEQCGPLPVYNDGVTSISCWKMTWRERLVALILGKVWLRVLAGASQPPVAIGLVFPFVSRRPRFAERVSRFAAQEEA